MQLTDTWDKTFAKSDKVDHQKIRFTNRYGIPLVGDLYRPKHAAGRLAALAVGLLIFGPRVWAWVAGE